MADEFEYDEQLHLIEVSSEKEAIVIAEEIGRKNEEWIVCESGENILWEFIGVAELFEINTSQSIIYSFTSRHRGADYINFVKSRHKHLSEPHQGKFIQSIFTDADQTRMAHL